MLKPLLIEIGVEELPAVPLLKELNEIEKKWAAVLEKNALLGEFEFYYTPRRLVLWHREFKSAQDDRVEEFYGAPVEIAIKEGVPTPAALGFAKKCGVEFDQLSRAEKGGKEVLYYAKTVPGRPSTEILGEMITAWIKSLSFGKSMRWGSSHESFIRPIRWVNVMLGEELVDVQLFNVRSSAHTHVHRISHFEAKEVESIHAYFDLLKEGSVILYPSERRERILGAFADLEKEHGITIEIDQELLDEVVAITEYPTPLLGRFDENFLELPPEVIITSMKEHQRYFPVFKEGKLINAFVVVSNALTTDFSKVIEGNERVLRPRLSDALFFYRNDLKKGLGTAGLEKVVFMNGLGTLADKIEREKKIVSSLAQDCLAQGISVNEASLVRAVELAKADLMSEMVYEFTELQGLMGSYYVQQLYPNEDPKIAEAIREQYRFAGEEISTPFSAVVNIAMKLDTLIGMFSIGEIPTGSRDPFALRRAVNGIIGIALKHNIPLDFSEFIRRPSVAQNYPSDGDYAKNIETFVIERLPGAYPDVNPSIIHSVVSKDGSVELDVLSVNRKINAVASIAASDSFVEAFSTFKRVSNILKDEAMDKAFSIDTALFENDAERDLYARASAAIESSYATLEERLDALFALKAPLDTFFDNVMVNAEDMNVRANRKALVGMIYREIYAIADIKNITL
ncbi:MAG: glycine--tRNA ligase subunit beta [Campylobacterales bacterium]|nr:glycine--tRNA ligase subunit beta [Campylobacterales bacterium]